VRKTRPLAFSCISATPLEDMGALSPSRSSAMNFLHQKFILLDSGFVNELRRRRGAVVRSIDALGFAQKSSREESRRIFEPLPPATAPMTAGDRRDAKSKRAESPVRRREKTAIRLNFRCGASPVVRNASFATPLNARPWAASPRSTSAADN